MHSDLHIHLARAAIDEHRRASFSRQGAVIALRPAGDDEDDLVRAIAELDSAPALRGPALLAVVDGWPVAAASLADGRIVANPMVPTAEAVELLRVRLASIRHRVRSGPRRRWFRRRPA